MEESVITRLALGQPTSSKTDKGDSLAFVRNLEPTDDGGYRTVRSPVPLISTTQPPYGVGSSQLIYGTVSGVHHAKLASGRDVILIHEGGTIKVFEGWARRWRVLIGPGGDIENSVSQWNASKTPTQFIGVANGVVIVPCGGRAYFYDGERVAHLGYDSPPAAPFAHGPSSSSKGGAPSETGKVSGTNDMGYVSDGLPGWSYSIADVFRYGRLGTVSTAGDQPFVNAPEDTSGVKGSLLPGRYRYRVQYQDWWGNRSPLSGYSNDVVFDQQPALAGNFIGNVAAGTWGTRWVRVDAVRKRAMLTNVPKGPRATVARMVTRTKDIENSGGDVEDYELPLDAVDVIGALGTMPDNVSETYPDNVPDAWLVQRAKDYDPVPVFQVATAAFGSLWVGNVEGAPSAIMISEPGFPGSFPRGSRRFPDAKGNPITAMYAVDDGVLVFTRTSTFKYTISDDGKDYRRIPVSSTIGCVAQNSVRTLPSGVTVWLAHEGFVALQGQQLTLVWADHQQEARRFSRAALSHATAAVTRQGQYVCWVPVDGALVPNLTWAYDGVSWVQRDDVAARGVCETQDGRQNVLVAGVYGTSDGVFVLDKGERTADSFIDTGWLGAQQGDGQRKSVKTVTVRLRETYRKPQNRNVDDESFISVVGYRDYRGEPVGTATCRTFPTTQSGPEASVWSDDSSKATLRDRRIYWAKMDISIPSCDVYRFVFRCTTQLEILEILVTAQAPQSLNKAKVY